MSATHRVDVEHEQELLKVFAARLDRLLDDNNYPAVVTQRIRKLATEFEASPSGARKWLRGDAIPSPGTLSRIAQRFSTSLDYLLGLTENVSDANACSSKSQQLLEIPIYAIDAHNSAPTKGTGEFRMRKSIFFEPNNDTPIATTTRFFAESWIDLNNPKIRKGDLLLVEMNEAHLTDNGIYLFRTPTILCIRRLVARVDGKAELIVEYGDRRDSDLIAPSEISFNKSNSPNEPAPENGIALIGRVVAKLVKLDSRIPGLF